MNRQARQPGLLSLVGIAMIACLLTPLTSLADPEKPLKVIFFGNSFTARGGSVNAWFARIAEAAGHPKPNAPASWGNGVSLARHIGGLEKRAATDAAAAKNGQCDYVVVQGYSTSATHLWQGSLKDDALKLFQIVKKNQADNAPKLTAVLYETWARRDLVESKKFESMEAMQAEIRAGYEAAAALIEETEGKGSVKIARVGDAFEAMGFQAWIYDQKGYHQSQAGALLGGMVFYRTIYGGKISDIAYDKVKKWSPVSERQWKQLANVADYGHTWDPPKSPTAPWLKTLTFDYGGVASGTQALRWLTQNLGEGATVKIDYSPDAGDTWANVASGVPATQGLYSAWDTTKHKNSAISLWRVVHEQDTSNADTNDYVFAVRNGNAPLAYYVNDTNTSGDVYCTAPGSSDNYGSSPSDPLDSLDTVLSIHEVQPRDTVYLDTGSYPLEKRIELLRGESGIILQGSTNGSGTGSGTVFHAVPGGHGFYFAGATNVTVRDLTVRGGKWAIFLEGSSQNCLFERLTIRDNRADAGAGIGLNGASGIIVRNCVFLNNRSPALNLYRAKATIENSTFYNNRVAVAQRYATPTVRNCIFDIVRAGDFGVKIANGTLANFNADYNIYNVTNGAHVAAGNPEPWYKTLAEWQAAFGKDSNSVVAKPLFADVAGDDFHLRSRGGRWDGTNWVVDKEHSPGIDFGDPKSDYSGEPRPNGGRANAGAYGNTRQASKTVDR